MARRNRFYAILAIALALASYGFLKNAAHRAIASANPNARSEISRLAEEMQWKPGMTIADIGAGDGSYSFAAEKIVGASGHVYATEIDASQTGRASRRSGQAKTRQCHHRGKRSRRHQAPHRLLRRDFPAPRLPPHHRARSLRQESAALAKARRASRHHRLRAGQQPPAGRRRPRQSWRPRHPAENHGRRINRGRISRRENDQSLVGQRLLRHFHEARQHNSTTATLTAAAPDAPGPPPSPFPLHPHSAAAFPSSSGARRPSPAHHPQSARQDFRREYKCPARS